MRIIFSSKTAHVTDAVKDFLQRKVERLVKFSSLGVEYVQIVIDRVKRGGKHTSAAKVELIANIRGKKLAFTEIGDNMYQAFFRAYAKIESKLARVASKSHKTS